MLEFSHRSRSTPAAPTGESTEQAAQPSTEELQGNAANLSMMGEGSWFSGGQEAARSPSPGPGAAMLAADQGAQPAPAVAEEAPASGPYTDAYGGRSTNPDLNVSEGQLTFDAEGTEGGRYHSRTAHWPGGASGVTIGRGYDLGQHSANTITADMGQAGVAASDIAKFTPAAGKTGRAAKDWLDTQRGLPEITTAQQKLLFEIVYNRLEADVVRISDNYARTVSERPENARDGKTKDDFEVDWETLHPAIKDLAVDLRYRGDYTPRTRVHVQPLMIANDLKGLSDVMNDRSLWSSVPKDRFERRAAYMREAVERGRSTVDLAANGPVDAGPGEAGAATTTGGGGGALYEVTASKLNVRAAPDSSKDNIVGALSKGDRVTASAMGEGWVQILHGGRAAWVSLKHLVVVPQAEATRTEPVAAEGTAAPEPPATATPAAGGEAEAQTTAGPTTAGPTTAAPTTAGPTTAAPTTAGPAPASALAGKVFTVTATRLNVRSAPDSALDNKVGALSKGERVTATGGENGWLRIQYKGAEGWISQAHVQEAGATQGQQQPAASTSGRQLSGASWYSIANQRGWSNSTKFEDLDPTFGANAKTFVEGLRANGAKVTITAGLRHKKRAMLMHFAWHVAKGTKTAAAANSACRAEGIDIEWDHGDTRKTRAAAQALVSAFGLVHAASLTSNHMSGEAIDMKITGVPASMTIKGKRYTAGRKGSGVYDEDKVDHIGKELGVIWFGAADYVHWSKTGR